MAGAYRADDPLELPAHVQTAPSDGRVLNNLYYGSDIHETLMLDFTRINLSDAAISAVRVLESSVEVDYFDWQERKHTLIFVNVISCSAFSPYGRPLSHGELETGTDCVRKCCNAADENSFGHFFNFDFVDA